MDYHEGLLDAVLDENATHKTAVDELVMIMVENPEAAREIAAFAVQSYVTGATRVPYLGLVR